MTLTLKPETEALVEQALASGRFSSADAAISTALESWLDTTPGNTDDLDALNQDGIDSAETEKLYTEAEAREYLASARERR